MARPQNSAKGRMSKKAIVVPASGNLYFASYSNTTAILSANSTGLKIAGKTTGVISANSTGIVLNGGIKVSNQANAVMTGNSTGVVFNASIKITNAQYIGANSTGFAFGTIAAKPTNKRSATHKIAFIKTAAGTGAIALNTTGTAWRYLSTTSILPT